MKNILFMIGIAIVYFLIAFVMPYFIQFKLNMLGVTFVTLESILKLWCFCNFIGIIASVFLIMITPWSRKK